MNNQLHFVYTPLLVIFSTLLLCLSNIANAQITKELASPRKQIIYFDLPSQTLKNSLIEFAIQSKFNIIVESELVEGFRSRPIVGPHNPENALKLLISKAPLTFTVQEDAQSIVIHASETSTTDTMNEAVNVGNTDKETTNVEEIVIRGTQFPFRYNTIANSQVYGNTAVFSSSRFINILPQTLITDQAPDDLGDLLKFSSGISPSDGLADTNDDFYIRGFPRYGVYLDGFRLSADTGTKLSMANIEQVEILKGPSTLVYGQAEPGGIVNAIRKKPKQQTAHTLGLSSGSDEEYKIHFDSTGSIVNAQQKLLYRLIAAQKKQQNFRDLTDINNTIFAPSISWSPSTNTIIDFSYEKQLSSQTREQGTVILAPLRESVDIVSIDRGNNPVSPKFSANHEMFTIDLHNYFTANWSLKSTFNQNQEMRHGIRGDRESLFESNLLLDRDDLDPNNIVIIDGVVVQGALINKEQQWLPVAVIRSLYDESSTEQSKAFKTVLNGDFDLGKVNNELTMGLNWNRRNIFEAYILEQRNDIQSLSLADRERAGVQETVEATFNDNTSIGELNVKQQTLRYTDYAAFLLNNSQLSENWRLSFGGRYTTTNGKQQGTHSVDDVHFNSYHQFSSEFGLHYQPIDDVAFYFNYSEGFKANYQVDDINTNINKPELSEQLELGIKTLLFDDSLAATAAIFKIDKSNVVDIKFIEGIRTASIQGLQSTLGLDMDFTYQINTGFNVLGSIALLDPTIEAGEYKGNTPELASKKMASLFLNYAINQDNTRGLSFYIGTYYLGKRYGNDDNNIHAQIPSFYTVDLGSSYRLGSKHKYHIQLGIKNALNASYIMATEGRIRSNHGAGRRAIASLTVTL